MGISFFETMSGELVDSSGKAHRVVVDIRCDASRLGNFARTGRAAITGTARAEPWADGVACEGTITIRPLLGRKIEYDVAFYDEAGARWRLHGRKSLSNRHPIQSATVLFVQLDREGVKQASGTIKFQMNDLLPFLLSWRLGSTVRAGREVAAKDSPISEKPLGARERQTLAAFAETTIMPGGAVPVADGLTLGPALGMLSQMPSHVQAAVRAGLLTLNTISRSRYRRSFAALSEPKRNRVVQQLRNTTTGEVLLLAMGLPVKMAHFSRRDYLDQIGIPQFSSPKPEPRQRWMDSVVAPEELQPRSTIECDVVVIGTGAGGAPVAAALAEQGHGVVMIEEGRYFQRPDFGENPLNRMFDMWRDGGMNLALGNSPVGIPVGRTVGGSTTVNSGVAIRTPDGVLNEWLEAGFPDDFRPEVFGTFLDRVEHELGVVTGEPEHLGEVARIVARGAELMGADHGPLPRNSPGCDGQGQCVFGCPTDAKRGANVSWVPRALRAGAGLYTGLVASRILMRGNRAVGVVAQGQDRNGAPRKVEVRAKAVVVAAGSLHTPLLLQRNGVRLPMLGKNLSIHPALGMMARLPEDGTEPWHAIPMGYFVNSQTDELVKFEGFYTPPQLAAATMPFDGPELTGWMDDWGKVAQFGFMVRDQGVGTVTAGPGGRPFIRYSLSPRVVEAFHRGSAELAEILILGGATQVETRIAGIGSLSDKYSARAIAGAGLPARAFRSMGFHPLGTAQMGKSPVNAVVDFNHQVFGTRDLFVVDGASVPTSLGVNPQVTIMAMALRAADHIGNRLEARTTVLPEPRAQEELQPA
jgi:choline dehydrogenase-like flavoprotein